MIGVDICLYNFPALKYAGQSEFVYIVTKLRQFKLQDFKKYNFKYLEEL